MKNRMTKPEIYDYLTTHNIAFEITEHAAVFSMEELNDVVLPYPEWDAKNLFVRDDKKQNYYLITVRGDKRVDLKAFRRGQGLRNLSFASPEELLTFLSLTPGSVSPFGLLNDAERKVHFYLDREFEGHPMGVHPNDNTATVWLQAVDLMALVQEHGNAAEYVDLPLKV